MAKNLRIFAGLLQRCQRMCKVVRGLYKDSPVIFILVLLILVLILSLVALFSACMKQLVGLRATLAVDFSLVWLFARLVARILMFPGSFIVFQRNTEATFRTEMSRQYVHYLRQLWIFLRHASKQSENMLRGVNADGIARGCAVIETLTASFQMQEKQHEVRLSREQELVNATAQEVERWLASAKVQVSRGLGQTGTEGQLPLLEWLRQHAAGHTSYHSLVGVELVGHPEENARSIARVEHLLGVLDELRLPKKSFWKNMLRFFQVPTVGSLNQLRTELQMRYGGQRCWVPTRGGRRLDAMFIPANGYSQAAGEHEAGQEDSLLKAPSRQASFTSGPTLIWCNPNAAYYETMVYQTSWLNFWLSRGINLFVFNYAGYGRSTGNISPGRIAEDSENVIRFLKSKGVTQVGVYGRSIGGVAACHIARSHPDFVQLLIADRTMSTLENAAKYMYGWWAARAIKVIAMVANNVDNFWEVRSAYKLLVVDPKDTMILDMASLRTAVALRVVAQMAPEERLTVDEQALHRLEEVWRFFSLLFAICECDEDFGFDGLLTQQESSRPARQPAFLREEPRTDFRPKAGENGNAASSTAGSVNSAGERLVTMQWLEENAGLVRGAMMLLADQVRSALDVVGERLEGGGVTLSDVFADSPNDACQALQAMLANLQVWGTLGDQREDGELAFEPQAAAEDTQPYAPGVTDSDMEYFMRKDGEDCPPPRGVVPQRLAELGRVLAPQMITTYHRRLARSRVAQIRREFRRRLGELQHAFTHTGGNGSSGGDQQANEQVDRLFRTMLHHLGEVERFVSTLSRFFKSMDLAVAYNRQQGSAPEQVMQESAAHLSDSSDEKLVDTKSERCTPHADAKAGAARAAPQPVIDHTNAGYLMHIDCGHNGLMDEVDMRQLGLHLRAARFGRDPSEHA